MKIYSLKHFFIFILLIFALSNSNAQGGGGLNKSCDRPDFFCKDTTFEYDHSVPGQSYCYPNPLILYYYFEVFSTVTSIDVSCPGGMTAFELFGPFANMTFPGPCAPFQMPGDLADSSITSSTSYTMNNGTNLTPGFYYLKITLSSCVSSIDFDINGGSLRCKEVECENCIGSFAPEPGDYIISMWTREEGAALTITSFTNPEVTISFTGSASTYGPFTATGQIIDGWQRIEGTFTVPPGATAIQLTLECASNNCLFDDIRVHPYDGSMKTYVYDPVSLKLVAELDERNYATIYEYDEEGKLLRIKKETERGIMTIQESKSSINKHQ